jgi:crotonobetainyl-CoA:carnitine CoA-transferase CaiB-like acyl-CoA transferase
MAYPLENLRVLDMSRVLAGPFAGRMLSDLGADVVKVEPPDGDVTRLWGAQVGGNPGYYHQQNAGKRNICIDLGVPQGRELVQALAATADFVIENFRPGVAARLGVGYGQLSAGNPRVVMLSISGFGQDGPEAQRAAFAPVIHAESGLIARQARLSGNPPYDLPASFADTNAALHGLVAVLSALLMRERTGLGQHIDMSMMDATVATDDCMQYSLEDAEATRVLPSEVWTVGDGSQLIISADFRHIWNHFSDEGSLADPAPPGATVAEKSRLRKQLVRDYIGALPDSAALTAILDRRNIAWGGVRTAEEIESQPTVRHRQAVTRVDDRAGGTRPIVQSPYRFSNAESGVRGPAPWKGEHNAEVLEEWLGIEDPASAPWANALVPPGT